jgi:hypothetical protein
MDSRHRILQVLLTHLSTGRLTTGRRSDSDNVENRCEQLKLAIPVGRERQSAMKVDQYASTARPTASLAPIETSNHPSKTNK